MAKPKNPTPLTPVQEYTQLETDYYKKNPGASAVAFLRYLKGTRPDLVYLLDNVQDKQPRESFLDAMSKSNVSIDPNAQRISTANQRILEAVRQINSGDPKAPRLVNPPVRLMNMDLSNTGTDTSQKDASVPTPTPTPSPTPSPSPTPTPVDAGVAIKNTDAGVPTTPNPSHEGNPRTDPPGTYGGFTPELNGPSGAGIIPAGSMLLRRQEFLKQRAAQAQKDKEQAEEEARVRITNPVASGDPQFDPNNTAYGTLDPQQPKISGYVSYPDPSAPVKVSDDPKVQAAEQAAKDAQAAADKAKKDLENYLAQPQSSNPQRDTLELAALKKIAKDDDKSYSRTALLAQLPGMASASGKIVDRGSEMVSRGDKRNGRLLQALGGLTGALTGLQAGYHGYQMEKEAQTEKSEKQQQKDQLRALSLASMPGIDFSRMSSEDLINLNKHAYLPPVKKRLDEWQAKIDEETAKREAKMSLSDKATKTSITRQSFLKNIKGAK